MRIGVEVHEASGIQNVQVAQALCVSAEYIPTNIDLLKVRTRSEVTAIWGTVILCIEDARWVYQELKPSVMIAFNKPDKVSPCTRCLKLL